MGFTRGCFTFSVIFFLPQQPSPARREQDTAHCPPARAHFFLRATVHVCEYVCVCVSLVCTVLCRMWMARLAPVIAHIPRVREFGGWAGGGATKGHEMTLQIQLLAFHLPLTATWRSATPSIPPPTRHTGDARPRWDLLRGGWGGGSRTQQKEPGNNLLL